MDTPNQQEEIKSAFVVREFDLAGFEADFEHFSESHSWYKHLPPPWGKTTNSTFFYTILRKGQQKGNPNEYNLDKEGKHWWFLPLESVKKLPNHEISLKYTIPCNALLRGVEKSLYGPPSIRNVFDDMHSADSMDWIKKNYPQLTNPAITDDDLLVIFSGEK
jgi:hypothetical protein